MGDAKGEEFLPPYLQHNALVTAIRDTWSSFSKRREALGLSNPGTVENIAREVQKDVFLNHYMFTGLRADWNRPLSVSPMFQYTHSFAMGSPGFPPYGFSTILGNAKIFMQANVEQDGQLAAQGNYRWTNALVTKVSVQMAPSPGQAMIQLNNDITGKDFTASLKSINPSIIEGGLTGIFVGSYLQSITPSLALGLEAAWQRAALSTSPESMLTYCAKYKGSNWIGSAQIQAQGSVSASYWRRLTEKVEAGVDLNLQFVPGLGGGGLMGNGSRKEGTATAGAKYDFRTSTFRAQLDSSGRLSCLVEKRVLPPVQITFAGEMDHFKQQAKVGLAVSIETASEEVMNAAQSPSASAPSVPF